MKYVVLPTSVGSVEYPLNDVWCMILEGMEHEQPTGLNKGGGMEIFQSCKY